MSQNGLTSLLVTWTQSEGPGVTGYTIYYKRNIVGEERKSVMAGAADSSTVISRLTEGATYSISMVANSSTIPSDVTTGPDVTIGNINCCNLFTMCTHLSPYRAGQHHSRLFSLLSHTGWWLCHYHLLHLTALWSNWYSSLSVGGAWSN